MKLSVRGKALPEKKGAAFITFITEPFDESQKKVIQEFFSPESIVLDALKGKAGETLYLPMSGSRGLVIRGLGKISELTAEKLRVQGAGALSSLGKYKHGTAQVLPLYRAGFQGDLIDEARCLQALAEGMVTVNYRFDRFKKKNDDDESSITEISFVSGDKTAPKKVAEVAAVGDNINLCRDLVNGSSHEVNAEYIARFARSCSRLKGMSVKVLGAKEIRREGLGLIRAVNAGSRDEARLVIMTYRGAPKKKSTLALVGKGITFDSGGMNLKRTDSIETMRMDMAGAATVLAVIKTAAELALPCNLYAVMPLTDNMLSETAYRPGDIFTSYSGKTVEIGNTDAEGRLVLADALAYTEKKLKPDRIIDLATLTGACVVTFGETVAAFMTEDEASVDALMNSSGKTGEKIWRLPFYDDYADRMKSDIADLCNMSSEKNAGTISAGVFLRHFVQKTPWVHIDIAGTAWYSKGRTYRPKYATGFGIRLLLDYIQESITGGDL